MSVLYISGILLSMCADLSYEIIFNSYANSLHTGYHQWKLQHKTCFDFAFFKYTNKG